MCGLLCSDEGGFVNGQMIGVNGGIDTLTRRSTDHAPLSRLVEEAPGVAGRLA